MRCEDVRYELAWRCCAASQVDVIEIPSILHAPQKFYSCLSCVLGPFIPPFGCRDLRLLAPSTRSSRCLARAAASLPPRLPPLPGPARPQSNPITTATMKLALSTLLVGSAAAFAPGAPASRSATQLHESKVRKRRKLSRATFDSRLSCLQVGLNYRQRLWN